MHIITELLLKLKNQISLVDTNNTFTQQHPTVVPSALQFSNFHPPRPKRSTPTPRSRARMGPILLLGPCMTGAGSPRPRAAHSLARSCRSQPRSAEREPPGKRGGTAAGAACCTGRTVRNSPREQVGCGRSFTSAAPSSPAAYRRTFLIIILSIIWLRFSLSQHTLSSSLKAPHTRHPSLTRSPGAR